MAKLDDIPPPSVAPSSSVKHGMCTPQISSCPSLFLSCTDSRPTLKDLQALRTARGNINVIEVIASKWKTVGIALSINSDRIGIIQADNPYSVEQSCLQMLQWWIDHCTPTWKVLIRALRAVGLNVLAKDIDTAVI